MMCFRDTTFCIAKCGAKDCHRKLTDKVKSDAVKWWGSDDAPVAVSDFSAGCPAYEVLK